MKENTSNIILLAVLFVVIGIVFGVASTIVIIPFAFLSIAPTIISVVAGDAIQTTDLLLVAGGGICMGLLGAAVNSILVAFRSTAVTLAYQEFVGEK